MGPILSSQLQDVSHFSVNDVRIWMNLNSTGWELSSRLCSISSATGNGGGLRLNATPAFGICRSFAKTAIFATRGMFLTLPFQLVDPMNSCCSTETVRIILPNGKIISNQQSPVSRRKHPLHRRSGRSKRGAVRQPSAESRCVNNDYTSFV